MDDRSAVAGRHLPAEAELSGALPAGYQALEIGHATIVARPAELPLLRTLLHQHQTLFDAALQLPRVAERQGRGVAIAAEFGGEAWLVRHYKRGGSVMRVFGDRYSRLYAPRVVKELMASEAARSRGVPTPQVKAGAWYNAMLVTRCDIAFAFIPEARDLTELLFEDRSAADNAVAKAADLIRLLIERGIRHRDLNLKNILIGPSGAYILDLDRCSVQQNISVREAAAMRERFFRSLRKWEARVGRPVAPQNARMLSEAFGG